ncbi:testis-expressed protein 48 isoform X2 [Mesocricetus auratus]|uniref:Testis-expressed protein 48 isoform X2 n=1 Tax=Mesocricetus auratus TaxID=10036 RepID=A0ABM2YET2_MESAU|nr:testis-expressed protein 48 isoform X2 [Mesocricetus auratus]
MATHQNLASKIFYSCCRDCEQAVIESFKTPSQTQENQQPTYSSQSQKNELNRQNPKHTNAQYPTGQERRYSSSSSDFEDTNINAQKGFQRRHTLNYSDNWPIFKTCNLGRP